MSDLIEIVVNEIPCLQHPGNSDILTKEFASLLKLENENFSFNNFIIELSGYIVVEYFGGDGDRPCSVVKTTDARKDIEILESVFFDRKHIIKTIVLREEYKYSIIDNKNIYKTFEELKNRIEADKLKNKKVEKNEDLVPIDDFLKLQTKVSKLYQDNAHILRKHIKEAYVEIKLNQASMKFNLDEETRKKYIKATYRIRWNLYESNELKGKPDKKMYVKNIIDKICLKYSLDSKILKSLFQTLTVLKKHEKNI